MYPYWNGVLSEAVIAFTQEINGNNGIIMYIFIIHIFRSKTLSSTLVIGTISVSKDKGQLKSPTCTNGIGFNPDSSDWIQASLKILGQVSHELSLIDFSGNYIQLT